jgi:FkbM family methyltransferase
MDADRFHSILYDALVQSRPLAEKARLTRVWHRLWQYATANQEKVVYATVHGQRAAMNAGYTYPLTSRLFRNFNDPLVELVHQANKALGRSIVLVDVGAAIGDTVLLIEANCPGAVLHYFCIDGDPQFFGFLNKNLGSRVNCTLINSLLSSEKGPSPGLVRTHLGTASAQGSDSVSAVTLDDALAPYTESRAPDVIKIDVDGYDGRVIAGADRTLQSALGLIFEWHPILYQQTGNDWIAPFRTLEQVGFGRFLWFTKFGHFSHTVELPSKTDLDLLAAYCLVDIADDHHWDVIALRHDSPIPVVDLARLRFAKARPSKH